MHVVEFCVATHFYSHTKIGQNWSVATQKSAKIEVLPHLFLDEIESVAIQKSAM